MYAAAYRAMLVILTSATLVLQSSPAFERTAWKVFKSADGFVINYPSSWFLMEKSDNNLSILSDQRRQKAVIIAQGESYIEMNEIGLALGSNFADYVRNKFNLHVKEYHLVTPKSTAHGEGCLSILKGATEFEVAPGAVQVNTVFLCQINLRGFVLWLTRWKADGRSREHEEIALGMMESLRLTNP